MGHLPEGITQIDRVSKLRLSRHLLEGLPRLRPLVRTGSRHQRELLREGSQGGAGGGFGDVDPSGFDGFFLGENGDVYTRW